MPAGSLCSRTKVLDLLRYILHMLLIDVILQIKVTQWLCCSLSFPIAGHALVLCVSTSRGYLAQQCRRYNHVLHASANPNVNILLHSYMLCTKTDHHGTLVTFSKDKLGRKQSAG